MLGEAPPQDLVANSGEFLEESLLEVVAEIGSTPVFKQQDRAAAYKGRWVRWKLELKNAKLWGKRGWDETPKTRAYLQFGVPSRDPLNFSLATTMVELADFPGIEKTDVGDVMWVTGMIAKADADTVRLEYTRIEGVGAASTLPAAGEGTRALPPTPDETE